MTDQSYVTAEEQQALQDAFDAVNDSRDAALAVITTTIRAGFNRALPDAVAVQVESIQDCGSRTVTVTMADGAVVNGIDPSIEETIEALDEDLWPAMSSLYPHTDRMGLYTIDLTGANA